MSGSVRVYRVSQEERKQVLVRLGRGQAFSTAQVDGRNPANAVALTPVTPCALFKEDSLRPSKGYSDLAMAILRDFAGRPSHLTDLVEGLVRHSVQELLARFLLDQASADPGGSTGGPRDSDQVTAHGEVQCWTRQEIAVHLVSRPGSG